MKILLVYPYFLHDRTEAENVAAMPIGLYYLAAALIESGHDVVVANWHSLRGKPDIMEAELCEIAPDVLAVSVFAANRWGALDAAKAAKRILPDVRVVFGGIGATFLSRFFLENFEYVDFIIRGEGERAFPAFLDALECGAPLSTVSGLSWREGEGVRENDCAALIENLDELPDPSKYFTFQHVILSRGCPGKCTFCGSPRFWGAKVRFHSPEYLARQVQRLAARGVGFFYVSDDTFTLRREYVLEFCRLLRERVPGAAWQAISRVDRVDEEILEAMRSAGCVQISYGVESGSPAVRERLRKKTDNAQIRRAFDLTTRYGMVARAYIIYGNPGETAESIRESAQLLTEIRPLVTLFHVLTVLPGTELYEQARQRFGISDEVWMNREEDLLWLDMDPELEFEQVHAWGKSLKQGYHDALPGFVDTLETADAPHLSAEFADFFARLGMTFDQGDYASQYAPEQRDPVAEKLYRRALAHAPDNKAFLGLGMLLNRNARTEEAVQMLSRGLSAFPDDPNLRLCLGIGLMNLGRVREALPQLECVAEYPQAQPYLSECRKILEAQDRRR
ncbi:B12-binding domain-containing radical SAM protein [Paucidesulfovibrio longus]|uniref:B12-binding domain-containing radical SAM protein n=1 Tax=Paucidesulfovibrio longus TaxID=889 RepID=UPI0003B754F9|nr:B12-binding domain-containing radical SAM protein [Paucidesulfovibrio longus]